jgi:phosphoribosylformylglycinamidine cyclo-ligase
LQQEGNVPIADMFNTFNMGIGFVVIVAADRAAETVQFLGDQGIKAYQIGEVVVGNGELVGLPTSK